MSYYNTTSISAYNQGFTPVGQPQPSPSGYPARRRVVVVNVPPPQERPTSSGGFFSQLFSWKGFAVIGALAAGLFLLARGRKPSVASRVGQELGETVTRQSDEAAKLLLQKQKKAAVKIQNAFRSFKARQELAQLEAEKQAATKIQSVFRGFQVRKELEQVRRQQELGRTVLEARAKQQERQVEQSVRGVLDGIIDKVDNQDKAKAIVTELQQQGAKLGQLHQERLQRQAQQKIEVELQEKAAAKLKRIEQQRAKQAVNRELRKFKKLYAAEANGTITPAGKARLKALQNKYPGHYAEVAKQEKRQLQELFTRESHDGLSGGAVDRLNVLKKRYPDECQGLVKLEKQELSDLFAKEYDGELTGGASERLGVLKDRYTHDYQMLQDREIVEHLPKARLDVQAEDVPQILKDRIEQYGKTYTTPDNLGIRLDLHEYNALRRLKNNPAYTFTQHNEERMTALREAMTRQRDTLQAQYSSSSYFFTPRLFSTATTERLTSEQSTLLGKLKKRLVE